MTIHTAASVVEFSAPIRILSEMNTRDHWTSRRRRFADQKQLLSLAFGALRGRTLDQSRAVTVRMHAIVNAPAIAITLTRVGARRLDSDNLASGFKACRDFIANNILHSDDGDLRLTWIYEQRKGPYAVEVRIEATP